MSWREWILLSIAVNVVSLALAYETLNCSPPNIPIDVGLGKRIDIKSPVVNFTYNRDSLALYLYPGTPSANLFINQSLISVKILGSVDDRSLGFINHEKQYATEIAGIANIANISDHKVGFKDCEFFVSDKLTGSFYNELPTKLEAMIYYAVEQCLSAKLCQSLGSIRYDDMVRGKISPRDFGPMSIWSNSLHASFPKMIPPKLANNNEPKKRANLVEAADAIVRLVADGYRMASNGMIQIPDAKHGIYSATKGTFSGLENLVRAENYLVKVSPPTHKSQIFSFTFGIPEGHVVYEEHHAFSLVPVVGSLCADVRDVLFSAVVAMDFSREYCRATLQDFTVTSKGTSKTYACGRLSFLTNPVVQWFVDIWDSEILVAIEKQIQWTMSAYVHDKFDCENFRPQLSSQSKNHV